MTDVLLDTHAWYWLFTDARRLPEPATNAIEEAETAFVGAISVYEIARKAQIGKWPGMEPFTLERLVHASRKAGIEILPASTDSMIMAGFMDWEHRDPWDRLIAAMALDRGAVLISADGVFDRISGVQRIWR